MSDVAPAAAAASPGPALQALRGLRTAPVLDAPAREALRQELAQAMEPCAWFTIGVMAPSAAAALATLRLCEGSLGWPALQPQELAVELVDDHDSAAADRFAAVLFYVATASALITFLVWGTLGHWDTAVTAAVTVLVIACPHALGLAIPLVVSISTALLPYPSSVKAKHPTSDKLSMPGSR